MLKIKIGDFAKTKYTWNETTREWVLTLGILGVPKDYHRNEAPGDDMHTYGEPYEVETRSGVYVHQRYVFNY